MKADISIIQSKKGTEIMVSGNKINKYGILAAILFTVPILLLFRWIHGEDMAHVSLLIFWSCALAGFGVNLLLHALFFGIFSPKGFRSISFVKHKGGIQFLPLQRTHQNVAISHNLLLTYSVVRHPSAFVWHGNRELLFHIIRNILTYR